MVAVVEAITSLSIPTDMPVESTIPGVKIFKGLNYMPPQPVLYEPGICILLQGKKRVSLGGVEFPYDADNYLVVSINVPLEAEIFATPEAPVIGMVVDIEMPLLHELISITGHPFGLSDSPNHSQPKAVEPAKMDSYMRNAIERMAGCLTSKVEAQALGPGIVREVIYRALCGPQSSALYALANHSGPFSRIAHVLRIIQTEYAEKLDSTVSRQILAPYIK